MPSGTDVLRKDVLESPRGLNGLVFRASDIDACQRMLRDSGLDMLQPQSFSRPVTMDGVEHLARFRTVRTAPEFFKAGRVYYCQHCTPELVWHRQWMSHPNGVRALCELVIVTSDPEADVPRYAKASQARPERQGDDWTIMLPHGFRLSLISPGALSRAIWRTTCRRRWSSQFFRRDRIRCARAWAHPRSRFVHAGPAHWNGRDFAGGIDSLSSIHCWNFGSDVSSGHRWILVAERLPDRAGIGGKFRAGA